jgi:hypothetical protein
VLRLYVTGMTERSMRAIGTLKTIRENMLAGRYDLEIINLFEVACSASATMPGM